MVMEGHHDGNAAAPGDPGKRQSEISQVLNVDHVRSEGVEDPLDPRFDPRIEPGLLEPMPAPVLREREERNRSLDGGFDVSGRSRSPESREQDSNFVLARLIVRHAIRVDFDSGDLLRQIVVERVKNPHS